MESSTQVQTRRGTATKLIRPPTGWPLPNLREVWQHRDLVYFLARRDLMIKYKQASIGIFWAVLEPVLLAVVFAVFLGLVAKIESPDIPYAILVISGMVLWIPFTKMTTAGAMSTQMAESLLTKIYFPRLVIPVSAVAPFAVDFILGVFVVVIAGLFWGFYPEPQLLLAPLTWVLATAVALGIGLWAAALNVAYRDFALIVPFLLLVGMFMTPIAYPFSEVPVEYQYVYSLNPMVGVLEFFRWSVLGTEWPGSLLYLPILTSVLLLVTGAFYYRRAEHKFADVI